MIIDYSSVTDVCVLVNDDSLFDNSSSDNVLRMSMLFVH